MCIIRSLKADEKEAMYDLLGKSFAKDPTMASENRQLHKKIIEHEPNFNYELNRVIEVDGKLVARIGICDRTMLFDGRELRVGAIGGVCTDPGHRGKGLARKLLQDCTTHMEKNGFDVSMLFGEPAIYGKSGWQTLSAFGIETNFELAVKSESTVRDACLKRDLNWLEKIHASHVSDYTGPFKRNHDYWVKWVHLRINASKRNALKIVEKNGEKSGYFALKADQTICEIGWDKNIVGAFEETVAAIFAHNDEETLNFNFFIQELFDFICDNAIAPTLDMMQNKKYYISKEAIYSGLFKLIKKDNTGVVSTEDFREKLRSKNYLFWDIDHF